MDELRDQVKRAFEEEWGPGAQRPGLEGRVSARLKASATGSAPPRRLVAVVAVGLGVLLLALAGGNLLRLKGAVQTAPAVSAPKTRGMVSPPVTPEASPSPAPEGDYGPPPLGEDLWYYVDPRNQKWIVAADWTGKPRGTIKVGEDVSFVGGYGGGILAVSPDGSRIILGTNVVDQRGNVVGTIPAGKGGIYWADDNRHLCGLTPAASETASGIPQTLYSRLPGGGPTNLVKVGTAYNQSAAAVGTCSITVGRALVTEGYNSDREWWLVNLLNGAVLHHEVATITQAFNRVVAAHDATYVAVINDSVRSQGSASGKTATVIRRATDGVQVARIPDGQEVEAFSWDGHLVMTRGTEVGGLADIRLIEWRTGREVWRLKASDLPVPQDALYAYSIFVRPRGAEFGLKFSRRSNPCPTPVPTPGLQTSCPTSSYDELRDILIVRGDGSVVTAPTRVHPLS